MARRSGARVWKWSGPRSAYDYDSLGGRFPGGRRAVDAFCAGFDVEGSWSHRGKSKFVERKFVERA